MYRCGGASARATHATMVPINVIPRETTTLPRGPRDRGKRGGPPRSCSELDAMQRRVPLGGEGARTTHTTAVQIILAPQKTTSLPRETKLGGNGPRYQNRCCRRCQRSTQYISTIGQTTAVTGTPASRFHSNSSGETSTGWGRSNTTGNRLLSTPCRSRDANADGWTG